MALASMSVKKINDVKEKGYSMRFGIE